MAPESALGSDPARILAAALLVDLTFFEVFCGLKILPLLKTARQRLAADRSCVSTSVLLLVGQHPAPLPLEMAGPGAPVRDCWGYAPALDHSIQTIESSDIVVHGVRFDSDKLVRAVFAEVPNASIISVCAP